MPALHGSQLFTARPASLPCLQVPISVVGLIDQDRLWLKSIVGVETREGKRGGLPGC